MGSEKGLAGKVWMIATVLDLNLTCARLPQTDVTHLPLMTSMAYAKYHFLQIPKKKKKSTIFSLIYIYIYNLFLFHICKDFNLMLLFYEKLEAV